MKEAIGTELTEPLEIGTEYFVSFKVCLAGQANWFNFCGVNKISMLFTNSKSLITTCNNCAQIVEGNIIMDTLSWTRITGSITADSVYSHISIGRFNNNTNSDSTQITGQGCNAYYYIDDVCVSKDSSFSYGYYFSDLHEISGIKNVSIFPNPVTEFLNIQFISVKQTHSIEIYSELGQLVFERHASINPVEHISISHFPSKVLLVKVYDGDEVVIKRVLKK